ncbi:MAG: UDP-N-acetylmuramate dehydrogenase [Phycisphaerales bacterium]|nr:UDP-N-acetylmuramate dehydrogenase [Phycisphaerales bacterium]
MPTVLSTSSFAGLDLEVEQDAPLGARTWFGVGGRVEWLIKPRSEMALSQLLRRCTEDGVAVRVLGEGANLLVDDEGIDGVVVQLTHAAFRATRFDGSSGDVSLEAGSGCSVSLLTTECGRRGLAGIEQLIGIPASLGGAIKMNAGGKYGDIASAIRSVRLMNTSGSTEEVSTSEAKFSYRGSSLPEGIIVSACLQLGEADAQLLRSRMKEISAYKANSQPLKDNSAGCMFRNPVDPQTNQRVSAGMLIDRAGLKGTVLGSAEVSDCHGNFITVVKEGHARDVRALAELVQHRVKAHCGISLEREVVFWTKPRDHS